MNPGNMNSRIQRFKNQDSRLINNFKKHDLCKASENNGSRKQGLQETRTPGKKDFRKPVLQGTRTSGNQDFWEQGLQETRTPGKKYVRKPGLW